MKCLCASENSFNTFDANNEVALLCLILFSFFFQAIHAFFLPSLFYSATLLRIDSPLSAPYTSFLCSTTSLAHQVNLSHPSLHSSGVSLFFVKDLGDEGSGVVQTSWAVLGLLASGCENRQAIDKGVLYIMSKQVR